MEDINKEEALIQPLEPGTNEKLVQRMRNRDLAMVSVFSALWIAAQLTLGPVLGRFSIGPVSLHGSVNRVVGWMLMVLLTELTGRFGLTTTMALVASLATRIIRLSPLTGFVTGAGYALGGLVFDGMFFAWRRWNPSRRSSATYLIAASMISGTLAIVPYLMLKYLMLEKVAFIALIPVYTISTLKGGLFSVVGTSLGLTVIPRIRTLL